MTTAELASVMGPTPANRKGGESTGTATGPTSTLPPRVLVVGDAADLERALAPLKPTRSTMSDLARVPTDALDVAVVDTRLVAGTTPPPPLVALALRLPTVLVSAEPGDEERLDAIAEKLGAATTVARPIREAALTREVRTLTELRRIRRALTVTNAALAHSVTGVAIADPRREDTPIVYVSPVFETMTGYAASDVLDKNCRFLAGRDTDANTRERLRKTVAAREPGRFVLRNFKKDGTAFWNELTIFPIYDEGGELLYIGGLQHDVTDLITARAELARTRDQLVARQALTRDVLDGVPVAVITTDEDLRITLMNRAATALLGTSADRCIGLSMEDALELPAITMEAMEEARSGGRSRAEHTFALRGSMPREIGISMRRAAGEQGFFIVLRDLAESRQAERIERLAAVSTMAAGFAHEVRNPLASLRMLCEMLQAELSREDPHQDLVIRMMNQVARVERLVRTSLQFARPQKPRKGDHWASVVLNSVLEALAPRLRTLAGELELQVSEDLPKIQCDDAQLVQILVVLVNNAIDAGGAAEGVVLRVNEYIDETEPAARWVRFSVEDAGPGIPEHQRAAIFHPFFTTKPSGTGLGLSIAQQLVHENGGRIELGAKTGRGAVFTVLIPALPSEP